MIAYLEERKNATLGMLGELPLVQREAFLLFVEGMALEEIAEATGVNEETVKSRIRYARNKLKQLSREQNVKKSMSPNSIFRRGDEEG